MSLKELGFRQIYALTGNPLVDQLMLFLAEFLVLLVPLSLIYLWFEDREGKEDSLFTAYSAVLSILIAYFLGVFYSHENPSATYDTIVSFRPENSFPSQHTAAMIGTALPLLYRDRERLGWLILAAGVLTGLSRIYVGEHWPIDILGSALAAGIGLGISYISWDMLEPVRSPVIELAEKIEEELFDRLGI
jgi:undecaprenyl-diphosphatase